MGFEQNLKVGFQLERFLMELFGTVLNRKFDAGIKIQKLCVHFSDADVRKWKQWFFFNHFFLSSGEVSTGWRSPGSKICLQVPAVVYSCRARGSSAANSRHYRHLSNQSKAFANYATLVGMLQSLPAGIWVSEVLGKLQKQFPLFWKHHKAPSLHWKSAR